MAKTSAKRNAIGSGGLPDAIALVEKLEATIGELKAENAELRAQLKGKAAAPPTKPSNNPSTPKKEQPSSGGGIIGWLTAPVGGK